MKKRFIPHNSVTTALNIADSAVAKAVLDNNDVLKLLHVNARSLYLDIHHNSGQLWAPPYFSMVCFVTCDVEMNYFVNNIGQYRDPDLLLSYTAESSPGGPVEFPYIKLRLAAYAFFDEHAARRYADTLRAGEDAADWLVSRHDMRGPRFVVNVNVASAPFLDRVRWLGTAIRKDLRRFWRRMASELFHLRHRRA